MYEQARGIEDDVILEKANNENRILVTNDKDFGEKIYRDNKPHKGIVLLRLADESAVIKIATLQQLLKNHPDQLDNNYIVVTESKIRIVKM